MSKNLRRLFLILYLIGLLTLSLISIFRHSLTDFVRNLLEVCSVVFIVIGFIYHCWCFIKKTNPYKF